MRGTGVTHGGETCDRSGVHKSECASLSQIRSRRKGDKGLTCLCLVTTARIVPWFVMSPTQLSAMNSSQSSNDSGATIEDKFFTVEVCMKGMDIQVSDTAVCTSAMYLPVLAVASQRVRRSARRCAISVRPSIPRRQTGRPDQQQASSLRRFRLGRWASQRQKKDFWNRKLFHRGLTNAASCSCMYRRKARPRKEYRIWKRGSKRWKKRW